MGTLVIALFMFSITLSGHASAALPKMLPETAKIKDVTEAKTIVYTTLAGNTQVCSELLPLVEFTKEGSLGTFHLHFLKCKATLGGVTANCSTAGDATEIILTLGAFHLVYDVLTPALGVAVLFEPEETTIECSALIKIKFKGTWLCLITPINKKVKTTEKYTVICEESTKGDPKEATYFNDAGSTVTTSLLFSFNGGSFESAAFKGETGLTAEAESEIMG
jgi:hypothetical protein